MVKPIGVVGTGLMGMALIERLKGAGREVLGYDVDPARRAELEAMHVEAPSSLAEIGRRCDRVLVAVMTVRQVEEVVVGKDGLLANRSAVDGPMIVLCVSTCEPDRIAALAERTAPHGLTFLDTPVSGTSKHVSTGDGLGLIAGDAQAVEEVRDLLDIIYPRRHYIGPAGDATKAKLAINLVGGLNRAALAEGFVFAERLGLDTAAFLKVARESAAYSAFMDAKGEKMRLGDYAPQGKIGQGLKDVKIMLAEAAARGQELPLGTTLVELLQACMEHGQGDWDNSSIIEEIRRRKS